MRRWTLVLALCVGLVPRAVAGADAFATSPASSEELETRWIQAHRSGDAVAAYNLFDWRGVTVATRQIIRLMIDRDLGDRLLRSMLLDPKDVGMDLPPATPGFEPNLPTDRVLVIEYEAADGTRHASLHRAGARDGVWRIALPVPTAGP